MHTFFFLYFCIFLYCVDSHDVYDRYSGKKTDTGDKQCLLELKPCIPHEGSRVDGTCNNFKHPSRGSAGGPYSRLLQPHYGNHGDLRMDHNGAPLPSARLVRTQLQSDGIVLEKTFTTAASSFLQTIINDVTYNKVDFLRKRTDCCSPDGHTDPRCRPIHVPHDDPYLRVTGIHCMNYSRIETFQDIGCLTKEKDPEQINYQTPVIDLSTVYGVNDEATKGIRLYEHGLLKEARRKERYLPLNETNQDICFQNKSPTPTCYKFGYPEVGNFDLRTTSMTIFFYRNHNRIARILQDLNPCWKDDRLLKVARQINIGMAENMLMYELLPELIGHKNLLLNALISENVEFVNSYDEHTEPLVYAEFEIAMRFYHTFISGKIKKFDEKYHYAGDLSYSDTLYQQEVLEESTNIEEISRGLFYQHTARIDDIEDPDLSEKFYSKIQDAHDLIAEDIQRGRDMGLPGYNSYRKFCSLKPATKFEDLMDVISAEKVLLLKLLYHEVEDVDLLAGIMSEELIPGLFVGPTLFCILVKQLQVFRFSDKFWFERGDQYHSFNLPQLHEIRKATMAQFACDSGFGIKFIQPHAFLSIGHGNEQALCSHIQHAGPDLSKWKDASCHEYHHHHPHQHKSEAFVPSRREHGSFEGHHYGHSFN